jgi:hypothetical protein
MERSTNNGRDKQRENVKKRRDRREFTLVCSGGEDEPQH